MSPSRKRSPETSSILWTAALLCGALLAGCAASMPGSQQVRSTYVTEHPEVAGPFATAIMSGQLMIGMSPDMVQAAWGRPQRVEKKAVPAGGVREAGAAKIVTTDAAGNTLETPVSNAPASGGAPNDLNPADSKPVVLKQWTEKYVYGNYLVNPTVMNLFFVDGRLKLIETVDTHNNSSVSVDDPNLRLLFPAAPSEMPGKGGRAGSP